MREPTEMELRVAKAIIDSGIRGDLADDEWTLLAARAAIRAMREPTNIMVNLGYRHKYVIDDMVAHPDVVGWHEHRELAERYRAMTDAASPEGD